MPLTCSVSLELKILIASASCLIVALSLSGGSLGKDVKWNLYKSKTSYCSPGGPFYDLYAYQTLWTSFDAYPTDKAKYALAYQPIKKDSWRKLARLLILVTLGIGSLSLATLLPSSLVPRLNKKIMVLNSGRIVSAVMSAANGVLLAYTLGYYNENYKTLKSEWYLDPTSCYPDEDNPSAGFYMAASACLMYFISAVFNIVNAVKLLYDNKKKTVVVSISKESNGIK